jgi:steroid 5-alpha reductase family enzyme
MVFLLTLLAIVLLQFFCAVVAIRYRTDKLTDLAYWWTFFVIIWLLYLRWSTQDLIHTLLVILVSLWSLRLALYLFLRVLAVGKDKRFDGIREQKHSFAKFRILQTVVIFLLFVPLIWSMWSNQIGVSWYTWVWVLVVCCGIVLESVADRQKFRFKQQYPTRWCSVWVWSKVQYPNYLGEMLVWIGLYMICLHLLEWAQVVVWLISPFTIIWLLVFITWIPPLKEAHKKQRGTEHEWKEYTENTPKLIPRIY